MATLGISYATSLNTAAYAAAGTSTLASSKDTLNSGTDQAATNSSASDSKASARAAQRELSLREQQRVNELKQIDAEVRAHEQAHITAGQGVVTSGPNYGYTYGPDGKQYAISGEVGIDTSPERAPADNIDKGRRIQDAALAPRDPSSQDYQVAATGGQLIEKGRSDQAYEKLQERVLEAEAADKRAAADERLAETAKELSTEAANKASNEKQIAEAKQAIAKAGEDLFSSLGASAEAEAAQAALNAKQESQQAPSPSSGDKSSTQAVENAVSNQVAPANPEPPPRPSPVQAYAKQAEPPPESSNNENRVNVYA